MIDIRQTVKYKRYLESVGWQVERINDTSYFIKKLPLIGSVIKIQRPEEIKTPVIRKLSKKHGAFRIIYEPKNKNDAKYLESCGYKLSNNPYLPTKTLHLNLTKERKKLKSDFKKDTRYSIKKAKENIKVKEDKNIKSFRKNWKSSVGFRKHVPSEDKLKRLKRSFGNDSLFLSSSDDSAGAIFLMGEKIGYYWQAFTGKKGRENLSQYKIVWEGILWAKSKGAKLFDFEGIYDERFPKKSWRGFTYFKKGFAGKEKSYPGAYTLTDIFKRWS